MVLRGGYTEADVEKAESKLDKWEVETGVEFLRRPTVERIEMNVDAVIVEVSSEGDVTPPKASVPYMFISKEEPEPSSKFAPSKFKQAPHRRPE